MLNSFFLIGYMKDFKLYFLGSNSFPRISLSNSQLCVSCVSVSESVELCVLFRSTVYITSAIDFSESYG